MSGLTHMEKRRLEELFGMASGCVLDFVNRTFEEFVRDVADVEIYDDRYNCNGGSKANAGYGTHMPRSDWRVVREMGIRLPKTREQSAIAAVLSDMDAEISSLESKLAKARDLKQGMMLELLTGRIRLV